jgi:STE24 endopeptidase
VGPAKNFRRMQGFTAEEVERARRYHRPLYLTLPLDVALGLGALAALAFAAPGLGLPWWVEAPLLGAGAALAAGLVRLPLSFWRGYVHEQEWGFSTQRRSGWLADRAKGLAVGAVLSAALGLAVVGAARAFPSAWPVVAASGAAAVVVAVSLVAPLVLEPLFNRFEPLADETLVAELRELAARARTPVRQVLVADASRRTRKENAYVSGLGPTRRVVLYDTLLPREQRQIRLVVAHELGHRRARHVAKGTALGAAGAALGVLAMWAAVRWVPGTPAADDPGVVPFLLLVAALLELLALPLGAAVSRRWEREADRASLELTHDPEAFEAAHRALATANLADLDPPRAAYLLLFSHPTPPERIEAARRWAGANVG